VLSTVDLDHELPRNAAEVDDERPDGVLPPEADAADVAAAQPSPQGGLGISRIPAQFTSPLSCVPALT
jgi:hypothetical protein